MSAQCIHNSLHRYPIHYPIQAYNSITHTHQRLLKLKDLSPTLPDTTMSNTLTHVCSSPTHPLHYTATLYMLVDPLTHPHTHTHTHTHPHTNTPTYLSQLKTSDVALASLNDKLTHSEKSLSLFSSRETKTIESHQDTQRLLVEKTLIIDRYACTQRESVET